MQGAESERAEPEIWRRNLAALQEVDAVLAETLAAVNVPASVVSAVGRDGELTYRIGEGSEAAAWFGRTSMPSISGPAILDTFDPGNGNVLLPKMGQGIEMKLLLERLPAHRAVFVLEDDSLAAVLALRLYDVSDGIRAGRLVLLTGGQPEDSLRQFLTDHGGYVIPDRILGWPWLSQADHQRIRLGVERAVTLAAKRFNSDFS